MMWSWIPSNWSEIWELTRQNAFLGIVSPLIGLAISLPLGVVAARWRWFYPPTLVVVNVIYAIPSLALFIALIPAFGLTDTTVMIGLTVFSPQRRDPAERGRGPMQCQGRSASSGDRDGVRPRLPPDHRSKPPLANTHDHRRAWVGVVSSVSLASVGQIIGVSSLGYLFVDGEQRDFPTEIYVGLFMVIALAVVCDLILVGVRRALTPWAVLARN